MATKTAAAAQTTVQPKGLRVGLVSVTSTYSISAAGTSLCAGDVIPTSFNRAIRALGAARWQLLHRCVYAIALLALLHFLWMRAGKNDFAEVAVYAAVIALLLGWRVLRLRLRPAQA